MAAKGDEEMDSLLSSFDQIYEDFKNGITEIQLLKSSCSAEIKKREALEFNCNSLKQDNGRLTKMYTESLNKLADQLERRTKCQDMEKELKRVIDEHLSKEDEHKGAMEMLKQAHAVRLGDLETQIRGFLLEKAASEATINHLHQELAANEATINHLHQELAANNTRIHALTSSLERVHFEVEAKYHNDIQDLKDCLMMEQEEKNELNMKIQNLEKELVTKLVEQQRDLTSNRQVGTLKEKMMKLRKENEVLKRQLLSSKEV